MVISYSLSVVLMILLPVVFAAWLRRRSPAPWLLFSIGSLVFIVSQVVHLPLNDWLGKIGFLPGESSPDLPLWRTGLTLGLTAGLCEELARTAGYAVLRRLRPGWLRLPDSIMLGLGHGGFEAMVFGGVQVAAAAATLLALVEVDLSTLGGSVEQLESLQMQLDLFTGSPLAAAIPLLERMLAISAHVMFSLIVWRAFASNRLSRDWYYIPIAIAYHTALDFLAVWGAQYFNDEPWLKELGFALALLPGWLWVFWLRRRQRAQAAPEMVAPATGGGSRLSGDLAVYWVATVKELRQLWRTKRLLILAAIFLIFGMGSPLLAKFTPEMLSSIEGAEMFADLIPVPTAGDAMSQYIGNITEFGFILAVVLGMGAVVAEKERGIAPLILSKPLPRWAFIASKLTAQLLMYLGGFILAGLGAYYYTIVLFGSLDFAHFALLNGLLFLWLMTFVSLSLLGSTLAPSTAAAGGIGLGFSVALMLLGTLPKYGALLPGGLLGWATQAGIAAAGMTASMPTGFENDAIQIAGKAVANGGAAASALIVMVMSLVLSIGIFEQQEL